jgi:hypothetical protein
MSHGLGFKRGRAKTGGRPKGTPNKVTAEARAAIAMFVEGNAGRLQGWLDAVADGTKDKKTGEYITQPNPARAFELFQTVVEYHVPKLARTEVTGANGGPVIVQAAATDEAL